MINLINFYVQGIHNIMVNKFKIAMPNPMLHTSFSAREKVIYHNNFMTLLQQPVN